MDCLSCCPIILHLNNILDRELDSGSASIFARRIIPSGTMRNDTALQPVVSAARSGGFHL